MQEWSKVVDQGPADRQFLRPAWFRAWELAYGDDRNWRRPVRYLSLSDGGSSQCVLPIAIQRVGPFRFASLCGTFLPFRGAPYCGNPTALASQAVKALHKLGWAGGVRLGPTPSTDPLLSALIEELTHAGWKLVRRDVGSEYIVENPGSAEAYTASLSSSRRKYIERSWRKLCQQGPTELLHYNGGTEQEWQEVMHNVRTVEAASWVAKSGEPRFVGRRNELFWTTLLADEWFRRAIHVWITHHQGRPVTFNLVLDTGRTRYGIATGYDIRVAKFSTGAKIVHHVNCDAFARGLQWVNRGLGDPGYKTQLGARALSTLVDVVAFCPNWVGSVAHLGAQVNLWMSRSRRSKERPSPSLLEEPADTADTLTVQTRAPATPTQTSDLAEVE